MVAERPWYIPRKCNASFLLSGVGGCTLRLRCAARFVLRIILNEDGSDNLNETIEANYKSVKQEILSLVESEIERIKNDANLKHLIKE